MQKATALSQLEQCVKAKEELEERLYVKFAQVLNSKKKKIRTLAGSIEKQGMMAPLPPSSPSSGSWCVLTFVFPPATVQFGSKLYQYGSLGVENGAQDGMKSAESSPRKSRQSPKKGMTRQGSSFEVSPTKDTAGHRLPGIEEEEDPALPRKPKTLLGSPEEPPPLAIKRKRRALLDEHDQFDNHPSTDRQSQSIPAIAPPFNAKTQIASPAPAAAGGGGGGGGGVSQAGQQQGEGSPSTGRRTQKRQKSDPNHNSYEDLLDQLS